MFKHVRSAALATALAALAGCAPVKLAVVPAAAYDVVEPGQPASEEATILESVREARKERKIVAQVVADGSARAAAKLMANRLTDAPGVLPSEARNMLLEAGVGDVGARWLVGDVGYNDRAPNATDLGSMIDALGPVGGTLYVGSAAIKDSFHNKRHGAVVVVPRVVSLTGLARHYEPGAKATVGGRFLEAVTTPFAEILSPDGSVQRLPIAAAADGTFKQETDVPAAPGLYVVAISGRWKGAERVLVVAPVAVGVPVAPWPKLVADFNVGNEAELEKALIKLVGDQRGKPVQNRKDLSDVAKTCALALAGGGDCAPAPEGTRLLAFDVPTEAIDRIASEIVATPGVRASWKPEATGIAVMPTKAGQFVVALVFPAEPAAEPAKPVEPSSASK